MQRARDETGQVLALTAILVPLLLIPLGAFAVDVGHWYVVAKRAQNTADAAALAAAARLPGAAPTTPPGPVESLAFEYVQHNYPGVDNDTEVDVVTPYDDGNGPNSSKVEVTVRVTSGTFFGRVIGVPELTIERRAVAEQQYGEGDMAIYVNSVDCDPGESLEFDGKDMHIDGWVHTEGGLFVSVDGSQPPQPNFTAGKGTMAFDPGSDPPFTRCQESINPFNQVADFVPGHPDYLPEGTPSLDWPVWYTPAQFGWYQDAVGTASPNRCRFKGNKIEIENTRVLVDGSKPTGGDVVGGVLPSGIYCAREAFIINASIPISGSITALAEEIKVNPVAGGLNLTAYAGSPDPVLLFTIPNSTGWPSGSGTDDGPPPTPVYCSHTKELQFNSDNSTWTGVVFNPCTRTLVNQSNSSGSGAIVTSMLKVNGNGFDFTGNNTFSATVLLALVE